MICNGGNNDEKIEDKKLEEYLAGMKEFTSQIKYISQDELKEALIFIGVLSEDGKPKEQICTDENYGG